MLQGLEERDVQRAAPAVSHYFSQNTAAFWGSVFPKYYAFPDGLAGHGLHVASAHLLHALHAAPLLPTSSHHL